MKIMRMLFVLWIILLLAVGCNRLDNAPRSGTSLYEQDLNTASKDPPSNKIKSGRITALSIIDDLSCWVGGKGFIIRSEDGGESWKQLYRGKQTIQQIYTLNDKQVWVVLGIDEPQILASTDGGLNWHPTGALVMQGYLHFISSLEGFVVNAHTLDGGKSWAYLPVPKDLVGNPYFYDRNYGWAVTDDGVNYTIQRTLDGGITWHIVMSQPTENTLEDAIIRSQGPNDAWVEFIGASGEGQTSYTLFHIASGGSQWTTVIANSTPGGGQAPGINEGEHYNINKGSKPGPFYALNNQVAFMGGFGPTYDLPNTIGWTTDGGLTWTNSNTEFPGANGALLAMADENRGWWICTEDKTSVLYTTADGGINWTKKYTFSED